MTAFRGALIAAGLLVSVGCGGSEGGTAPVAPTVSAVTVTPLTPSVAVGQTVQLTAAVIGTGSPSTGVTWTSSDVTKATVNASSGLVTGVAAGSSQVCAKSTFDAAKSGCATVTVTGGAVATTATVLAPAGFAFNPATVTIAVGGTVNFTFESFHNVAFAAATGAPANIPNTSTGTVSRQFATAGTFNFQCTLHAGMNGSVVVR